MDIAEKIAVARFWYYANMTSIVNVANQLHILSDEKAEEVNKNYTMAIVNDIIPRLSKETLRNIGRRA